MAHIGVCEDARNTVSHTLNVILADEFMLYSKLLKYHWNVTGMSFGPLHQLFEDEYTSVFKIIDDVAERVRAIGHWPIGTLKEYQEYTHLEEHPGRNPDAHTMISDLVKDYETIIRAMRSAEKEIDQAGDAVTANFLEDIVAQHEKAAWMLRSHLV